MTTHRSIRTINLSTALLLLGGAAGCGGLPGDDPTAPAGETTSITGQLSPVARKMALENQLQYQKAGLKLAGRVWFAPDAYGEIYDPLPEPGNTSGDPRAVPEGFVHLVMRGSSPLAKETALRPQGGESVDQYIARTRPDLTPVRFDLESGAPAADAVDVLLFQPAPVAAPDADLTTVKSAIVNQRCPLDNMNALCAHSYGYTGSTLVGQPWAIADLTDFTTSPVTGTSMYGAVCADAGAAEMTFFADGVRKSVTPVAEGFADWHGNTGSWAQIKWCSSGIEPICFDYHYSINYFKKAWTQQLRIQPGGGNAHICGAVMTHADRVQDESCAVRNNCPTTVIF